MGKQETAAACLNAAANSGKVVFIGNPASDMLFKRISYWNILRRQLTVTGTWNSSFTHEESDDWHYVLERLKEKRIHPSDLITHKLPMEELKRGFIIMRDKSEEYVKIMGVW